MKGKTLGTIGIVVAAIVAVVVAATTMKPSSSGVSTSSSVAQYSGETVAVGDFSLASYRGKPVVVNLFGSWCPPCNDEAPDLARFAEEHPEAQVIGIACQDTQSAAEGFMTKYGLSYPLVVDDGSLVGEFGVGAFPTTVFYDDEGNEVDRIIGAAGLDQFNAGLAKAQ